MYKPDPLRPGYAIEVEEKTPAVVEKSEELPPIVDKAKAEKKAPTPRKRKEE